MLNPLNVCNFNTLFIFTSCYRPGIEADGINLLLALTQASTVQQSRLEAKRPPASAGPPSGRQAASLTSLSSLYSIGTCCPV